MIGTTIKDSDSKAYGMAEYKGKVKRLQDTPFGNTLPVIARKRKIIIYLTPSLRSWNGMG